MVKEIDCSSYNYYIYFISIFNFIIYTIILISFYEIENNVKCDCVNNNLRIFSKEWIIFLIIYKLILLSFFFISNQNCWRTFINTNYLFIINTIISIITIVVIVRIFLYMRFLRDNCECAYKNKQVFIYWYYLILLSILLLLISVFILFSLLTFIKFLLNK